MNAFELFVRDSATSYLQSVVFVDDMIYESEGGKPLESSPVSPNLGIGLRPQFGEEGAIGDGEIQSKEISKSKNETAELAKRAIEDSSQVESAHYHPRELMESFAQEGIVCALYEPRKGFKSDSESDLFRLCERADVVILDWDLYNDDGDAVSELLAGLVKKSEAVLPHHVRLCALYTNRPSLHPVLDKLFSKLKESGCAVDVDQGKLRLMAGATRIAIFGKPVSIGRPPDDKSYEVKEADLAERIITEFASLHSGVMPAFALHGLAAIRRNTKRLLDKFRSDLDGPFLLHRALVLEDTDAFEELPELLCDEIRAVLEDAWPVNIPLLEISCATIDTLALEEPNPGWKRFNGQPYPAIPTFREILKKGTAGLDAARNECNEAKEFKKRGGFREANPARLKDFETMLAVRDKSSSEHLAALFCNRTQYGAVERTLKFGTIVRHKGGEGDKWSYSMCLMPICDSQRLTRQCAFPFWKLKEDAKCGLPGRRFGLVVVDAEGNARSLAAGGKIRDMLWMTDFTPTDGWVIAANSALGFRFGAKEMIVEWMADLKPLHAQRIAAYLGAEVSRVGLVESEWLRLFCDR